MPRATACPPPARQDHRRDRAGAGRPRSRRSRPRPPPMASRTSQLGAADLARLEPALRGVAGLLSPSTGIIDSHGLMLSLRGEIEDAGAVIAFSTRFLGAAPLPGRDRGRGRERGRGRSLATRSSSTPPASSPARWRRRSRGCDRPSAARSIYCKGTYFTARGAGAVPPSDLSGARARRARRAPDPRHGRPGALRAGHRMGGGIDYGLDPARGAGFYAAIRRYWPELADGALRPAIPASGRSSRPTAGRPPISRSRGRRRMGSPASSTSSASRAPASPRRSPSPRRWRPGSRREGASRCRKVYAHGVYPRRAG